MHLFNAFFLVEGIMQFFNFIREFSTNDVKMGFIGMTSSFAFIGIFIFGLFAIKKEYLALLIIYTCLICIMAAYSLAIGVLSIIEGIDNAKSDDHTSIATIRFKMIPDYCLMGTSHILMLILLIVQIILAILLIIPLKNVNVDDK